MAQGAHMTLYEATEEARARIEKRGLSGEIVILGGERVVYVLDTSGREEYHTADRLLYAVDVLLSPKY